MLAVTLVEYGVWAIASAICLMGALGVVLLPNPIHNALSLVATLFGVAVLFVSQQAYFLAVIQVIVYAGAIVVLFLFVIMLLGVDQAEGLGRERQTWRRPAAIVIGAGLAVLVLVGVLAATTVVTGEHSVVGKLRPGRDVQAIGEALFTRYVYAFEITAVLLTIAVIGAVVLSRRPPGEPVDLDELPPLPADDWGSDDWDADDSDGDDPDDEPDVDAATDLSEVADA